MTREVVLYELMSIDGVSEEPGDWVFELDDELYAKLRSVISRQDDLLMGRGTYDYWSGYWPTADADDPVGFKDFINAVPKHVFTSREPDDVWENSTFVRAPLVDYVRALQQQPGRDIGVHASLGLASSLLEADLVDRLELVVAPTVATRGRRLFEGAAGPTRLELAESARTPSGLVLSTYRRPAVGGELRAKRAAVGG